MNGKILDRTKFIEGVKEQLTINPRTTALIAVDMHQDHLDPAVGRMIVPEDERKRVLVNSRRLLEIARKNKIPIIHIIVSLRPIESKQWINPFSRYAKMVNTKLKPEERSWAGKTEPTEGWWQPKIMPDVNPLPDDFVINTKKTYSIFLGTDLEHLLKILGIDTIVIIGINTNTCVLCSSFDTVNRGYKLIVISDCVASAYGHDLHFSALQNIARCLGWVLTISEFEEKLKTG